GPAIPKFGMSSDVGCLRNFILVPRDEHPVLGQHEIGLDKIGALLDGKLIACYRMLRTLARSTAVRDKNRGPAVQGGLCRHRLNAAAGKRQQPGPHGAPALHAAKRACQSLSENPTLMPSPDSTTGRRIIAGCASISAFALVASRPAFATSGSLRKVVPLLLSSFSQPTASIHRCKIGR